MSCPDFVSSLLSVSASVSAFISASCLLTHAGHSQESADKSKEQSDAKRPAIKKQNVSKASLLKLFMDLKVMSDPSLAAMRTSKEKELSDWIDQSIKKKDAESAYKAAGLLIKISSKTQPAIHKHAQTCKKIAALLIDANKADQALDVIGEGIVFARADKNGRQTIATLLDQLSVSYKKAKNSKNAELLSLAAGKVKDGQGKSLKAALAPVESILALYSDSGKKRLNSMKLPETKQQSIARLNKEKSKLEKIESRNFRQSHRLAAIYDELTGVNRAADSNRSIAQKEKDLAYMKKSLQEYKEARQSLGKDKVLSRFKDAELIYSGFVVERSASSYYENLADLANSYFTSKKFAQAGSAYKEIIDTFEHNLNRALGLDAFWRYALCLVATKKTDQAKSFYKELEKSARNDNRLGDFRKRIISCEARLIDSATSEQLVNYLELNKQRDITTYFLVAERLRQEKKNRLADKPYRSLLSSIEDVAELKPEYVRGYVTNLLVLKESKKAHKVYTDLFARYPELNTDSSQFKKDELSLFGK